VTYHDCAEDNNSAIGTGKLTGLLAWNNGCQSTVPRIKTVYICHPYQSDPAGNSARCLAVCRELVQLGYTPIAPQTFLAAYCDEHTGRGREMEMCLQLMSVCDLVLVIGDKMSEGMRAEIKQASRTGKPIDFVIL
jgi:hypothetical protein